MTSIIDKIDAAMGCQHCGTALGSSPSDDFCSEECQRSWAAGRADRPTTDLLSFRPSLSFRPTAVYVNGERLSMIATELAFANRGIVGLPIDPGSNSAAGRGMEIAFAISDEVSEAWRRLAAVTEQASADTQQLGDTMQRANRMDRALELRRTRNTGPAAGPLRGPKSITSNRGRR